MTKLSANKRPWIQKLDQWFGEEIFSWKTLRDYSTILLGVFVQALAMRFFLVPSLLLSGGISGAAQIINYYWDWNIGFMTLIGNIPLFILGWRYLGGPRFAFRTLVTVLGFSILTDALAPIFPAAGITSDLVLNSVFGGIVFGIGLGLVYVGKGTSGGSDILAKILYHRLSIPMTMAYLVADAIVVVAGGFAWNWELAMYGLIVIYVSGMAAQLVVEGKWVSRSAIIISYQGEEIAQAIMTDLERGVTYLSGKGAYTGEERPIIYCVINRAEMNRLKELVRGIDPLAFMVIGQANEVLGEGFKPLHEEL
jgi:uncharacterized membrane-anchored protein YitT (DUF2179 family)